MSIALAVILAITRPAAGKAALNRAPRSVVVLITGVLTYIHMLQEASTVDWVSAGISAIGIPLKSALLLFYMSGFVAGLAIAATIVDISPFSANGAMLLAIVDPAVRESYYRGMLFHAGAMCLMGPGAAWLVVAVPTWAG